MLRDILTLSALILAVLLVRAAFKNRVPKRTIYGLWLVVLLKLCLPGTLFSLPVLPAEEVALPAKTAQTQPAEEVTLPAQPAPAASAQLAVPTQTVSQPGQPEPQPETKPVTPAVQETAKPVAKPLTTAQILQIVWAVGSGLLGLWLFATWLTFTIRLHKSRKFLGKRGRTNIYVSRRIKSPCLAGLVPAVYLTEDVLRNDTTELILRHELTHLHHLDFLWSLCRTLAVIVYWWNPLVWLAAIFSKRDAELACDEAVAAGLQPEQRIAYARAILAQAPRKKAALSLAGPPVKERILFLTKKQKTSAVCIVLALAITVSATGCSFAEFTRREAAQTVPSTEESQSEVIEAQPEDTAVQAESTSLEEQLPVDETARAQWADFADKWRLDYLPVFSRWEAPGSTSDYLMWVFSRNMDAFKAQGYMTKDDVESEIWAHFEVKSLTHEPLSKAWAFDGETYTAIPSGVNDRPLARLDSVIRVNLGTQPQYCVQYCLLGSGNLLDDAEWSRCREEIIRGDAPDLTELREFTLVFTMQDGEPIFQSLTELRIDEPPFTPLPNDGTYDVTQPLQDWELTRTNGVQTGMTQAQIEAITGPLTPNGSGSALLDSQNVSYRFRQMGYRTPQLAELRWNGTVKNDEIICETAQDAPSFRGICLGDTIDEVFDKFPCTDRELKQWAVQYVYGFNGASDSAALSFIADSFYTLTFTVNGQRRATISFSRVQQRVFEIDVYADTYWRTELPEILRDKNTLPTPTAVLGGRIDLSALSYDALGQLLDELNALRPDGNEAENEKWAAVSAVKNELVNRAKEDGYSYREPVTFKKLNEMIGYRLMNNEILMNAYPDDDAQMEVCRKENADIEAFRATLPENGSDEEAYVYWRQYWQDVIHQPAPTYFAASLSQTDFEAHLMALSNGKTAEGLTIDTFPDVLAQDAALRGFLRDFPEKAALFCATYLAQKMWYGAGENEPYTQDFAPTALGRCYVLLMQYLMESDNNSTGQLAAVLSHTLSPESWLYQLWSEVGFAFAKEAYTLNGIYYDEHPIEKQCMTALLRSPKRLLTATLFDYANPVDSERVEDDRFALYDFLAEGKTNDRLHVEPAGTTREDLLAACTERAHWKVEGGKDTTILHITPETGQELRLIYSRSTN